MSALKALETRIPPPVVALAMAFLMWNTSVWSATAAPPAWRMSVVAALVALGAL